jgi:hypothetical protein
VSIPNRTCFTILSFIFKPIFIVPRVFTLVFHLWIYHTLIRLTPFIVLPFLFPPIPYYSIGFNMFCHLPTQMQCILMLFDLYHSLFPSFLPLVLLNSLTKSYYWKHVFYVYMIILYLCTHLFWIYLPHKGKHATFVFLNLASSA